MNSRTSFFYGWVIVAVTIPVLMITAGIRSAPGAWIVPMKDDLGWSIASLSFAAAMGLIVYGFSGPLSGNHSLSDKL